MSAYYDFLIAECPNCGERIEAEVKGDCVFNIYDTTKPINANDAKILSGNVVYCEGCHTNFQVIANIPVYKVTVNLEEIKNERKKSPSIKKESS